MRSTTEIDQEHPILLFGSHRSGTTWLGQVLSQARDVAYWSEPRQVWVYRNWFRPTDVLTEENARPPIVRYIRRRFQRYTKRHGKRLFCEKTPSNCLRVRFVRAIYPQGRYILIVRDGRAVLRSTQEIIERGGPRWQRMWEKVWEATVWEWPAYLEKWPWVVSKLLGRTHRFWGTRPPGWRDWLSQLAPELFFARQWAATMDMAIRDFQEIPEANRRVVRYEHLMSASAEEVRQLVTFTGTEDVDRVVEALLQTREPARHESWREAYQPHELEALRSELEPTLNRLGYTW